MVATGEKGGFQDGRFEGDVLGAADPLERSQFQGGTFGGLEGVMLTRCFEVRGAKEDRTQMMWC